jgi:YrbI family 3-deoxy-D-manno-octulosonate 8-phosphate phosphatase
MTDDYVYVDTSGNELVRVSRADGMAVKILEKNSIQTVVISSETNAVVAARCKKLGIEYYHNIQDKAQMLVKICAEKKISLNHVAYVGNDVNDLTCLKMVGLPLIVRDAANELKNRGFYSLPSDGGDKVLRIIADMLGRK